MSKKPTRKRNSESLPQLALSPQLLKSLGYCKLPKGSPDYSFRSRVNPALEHYGVHGAIYDPTIHTASTMLYNLIAGIIQAARIDRAAVSSDLARRILEQHNEAN